MGRRSATHRSLLGAVAPVVLLMVGPAGKLSASCGDYVHVLPPDRLAPEREPAHRPTGPGCQSQPDRPPAPAPTTSPTAPHDAILAGLVAHAEPAARWAARELFPAPRHVPRSVFHPPREG